MTVNSYYNGPRSDHFDGQRFFNPVARSPDPRLRDILRWRLTATSHVWNTPLGGPVEPEPNSLDLRLTLIGHASVLIQMDGQNILVDPMLSKRASPFGFIGPARANPPAITLGRMPTIHTILVTHNHYDHLDLKTLGQIWQRDRPRIITALGNDRIIAKGCRGAVAEALDWGQAVRLRDTIDVAVVAAQHWSGRGIGDRRMALWCGFFLRSQAHSVYIAGDTGYGDGSIFRAIRGRYGVPDVAIIPIGAYAPRWFMKPQHADPTEAVQILEDCGSAQGLGVHWGTFPFSDEPQMEPPSALGAALDAKGLSRSRFIAMRPGDVWHKAKAAAG